MRWCFQFKLNLLDLVTMTAEHNLSVAHTTIMRRVQRYVTLLHGTRERQSSSL
jgi:transposase-like protein